MRGSHKAGYTLIEILMVLAIFSLVIGVTSKFILEIAKGNFITEEKLEINADVRKFTLEMAEYARAANHFFIYNSFAQADRNEASDRLRDGSHGDFLLLIYQEPWPNVNNPEHITRLVGYFRAADGTGPNAEGPVYRFERRYHPPGATSGTMGTAGPYRSAVDYTVESLISDLLPGGTYTQILELSRGLADGQLFHNYRDRSIMVNAEIIHGNAAKRVTDTYNYTVSPRG